MWSSTATTAAISSPRRSIGRSSWRWRWPAAPSSPACSGRAGRRRSASTSCRRRIKAFSYDVDFEREIHPGDRFEIVYERYEDEQGRLARTGNVLYAPWCRRATNVEIYRFQPKDGSADYYNSKGESVRKELLRTPLDVVRITSDLRHAQASDPRLQQDAQGRRFRRLDGHAHLRRRRRRDRQSSANSAATATTSSIKHNGAVRHGLRAYEPLRQGPSSKATRSSRAT